MHNEREIENTVQAFLNEFREIIHRYARFSHRNDSLDFLAKVIFSHVAGRASGGSGIARHLMKDPQGAALALRNLVEKSLSDFLPNVSSSEIHELSNALKITEKDNSFAIQVIELFCDKRLDQVLTSVIRDQKFDILNDIFGRFVTDAFVEEKEMGQYLTPPDVVKVMSTIGVSSLSPYLQHDLTSEVGNMLILDPSCGVGSFLVEAVHALCEKGGNSDHIQRRVVGIDKSERMVQLAVTNLALLGGKKANVILTNALDKRSDELSNSMSSRVALILTNPPFGASFLNGDLGNYEIFNGDKTISRVDSEILFIERYIDWLCPGGILVAIVPDSVLTNRGMHQQIREYISRTCEILSVISLPPVTFAAAGTTTKTSILHIKKKEGSDSNRSTNTYFAVCDRIGYEVVTRGAQRRKVFGGENDLHSVLADVVGESQEHEFGRSIHFDPSINRWDAKFNSGNNDSLDGVSVSELASLVNEKIDPKRLGTDEFEYIEIADVDDRFGTVWSKRISCQGAPSRARKRVRSGDVLMSTVRPERGCVGVVPDHLNGAICSTGFAVLRPKQIDPYFLVFLLKSEAVTEQINRIMSGVAYPSINETLVPSLVIPNELIGKADLQKAAQDYSALAKAFTSKYVDLVQYAVV
ncbi:N-6 DNA methylase [Rhizobium ruizarguesonis]|uniref:N-6 DNA methylase n=1 Tax=Rhizobium ruizarguesonis TaxID=2081791 RepID=UPI001031DA3E|nr:N-6 DNA methylase [Rhizobium ruizarguesonis]TAY81976.1 restriction endonuclease subunit M/S [Rhizobium ruizarguesonis]